MASGPTISASRQNQRRREKWVISSEGSCPHHPAAGRRSDGEWRAELTKRIATVRGFVPMLCEVIALGATAEGEPVLEAMKTLPQVLGFRSRKLPGGKVPARLVEDRLVHHQRPAFKIIPTWVLGLLGLDPCHW
ncbi:hypothetical protein [Actinoallomurus rhizosphaericola]|uniref:hypothetical protein n=1 Tax=Actinoallomurus rhizosphaericola TaxID=2952536 RepID=UPI00209339BB|nr:hypothetical protein [Actinoallomurus rhizosphaericola]MCO5999822.1 hypothetical protein [Actinoallomurus rhizosphaericola]